MKIITVFPSFANKGGAEDIAISIAQGLNTDGRPIILQHDTAVCEQYGNLNVEFEKFNVANVRKYHKQGGIFISHHRKSTTFLILISKLLFFNKLRVIHVAHNTFSSLKNFTLFPQYNIAVSKTVKENMISYFGLKEHYVEVIYNGLHDNYNPDNSCARINGNTINVLFLGRIVPEKRQIEFVSATKGKLNKNIRIYFGGKGKDFDNLRSTINNNPQYVMLGLIDVYNDLYKFDYVCLFSEKEGLPLSLIQGGMFHKPLLTNDIPQCLEINIDGYGGFVCHTWDDVIKCINTVPSPDSMEYLNYSNNSRAIFEKLFNYDAMIRNYKKYINSIDWN